MQLSCVSPEAELVSLISSTTPVGIDAPTETVASIEAACAVLEKSAPPNLTDLPLTGVHDLLFSMAKGGSNGKLGPFTGKVTQTFVNDSDFVNAVELGPVKVMLKATREVLDAERVRVSFVETVFTLFGKELFKSETKGTGVWKFRYFNKKSGVRVMDTPSLFILKRRDE